MTDEEIAWICSVATMFGIAIRIPGFRGMSQWIVLPRYLYDQRCQA
jgi:hypothetical protein